MKILYFGTLDPTSTGRFYAKAFEDLGHQVQTFDPLYFQSRSLLQKIWIKARKAPIRSHVAAVGEELIQLCHRYTPDWIFVLSENFLEPHVLEALKQQNPRLLITFHSHDNLFFDGILKSKNFFESVKHYDIVFTNKTQNVARYQALGAPVAHFIPSAYEASIHKPVPDDKSLYGEMLAVSFVGTYDHSRDRYIEAVGWDRLNIWGNGWRRYHHYLKNSEHIVPRAVYTNEFADVVSHSRINLGLLREEADDRHTIRTFEIPACGGFQLAPRNDEILRFFDENREIACFGSPEELKDKVDYYLAHESERKKIAEAGYQKCVKAKNSYYDRVSEMCEVAFRKSGIPSKTA
jgi:spore maturation protein CgeB